MKPVFGIAPVPSSADTQPRGDAPATDRARRIPALARLKARWCPGGRALAGLRAVCLALLLGASPAFAH